MVLLVVCQFAGFPDTRVVVFPAEIKISRFPPGFLDFQLPPAARKEESAKVKVPQEATKKERQTKNKKKKKEEIKKNERIYVKEK